MELQISCIGHIGQDASVNLVNGKSVLNFSVAHTEKWKRPDGTPVEKTTWLNCSMWEKDNVAQYLKKGTLVSVHGTPEAIGYTTKTGEIRGDLKCTVQRLKLLSAAPKPQSQPAGQAQQQPADATNAMADVNGDQGDLPF